MTSTAVRALLSIVIVGMGAAVGREAALKDGGAAWASKLSQWVQLTPDQRKLLVACGTGAGMAAAYTVPLGGAAFVVEVLLGRVAISTVLPALTASFLATAVSWLLLPDQPTYKLTSMSPAIPILVWAIVAGR